MEREVKLSWVRLARLESYLWGNGLEIRLEWAKGIKRAEGCAGLSSPKKGAGSRLYWGFGGFRCCASAVGPGRGTAELKQIFQYCAGTLHWALTCMWKQRA